MTTLEKLKNDLKEAMKARNEIKLNTVRMVLAALKNRQIETKNPSPEINLPESEILALIDKERKKRREAAELFRTGGRAELAEKEEEEMKILSEYLPPALSEAELDSLIDAEIQKGIKEFGPLMKAVMASSNGRADGRILGEKIKAKLAA